MDSATASGAKKKSKMPAAVKLPESGMFYLRVKLPIANDKAKPQEREESSVKVENDHQVACKSSSVPVGKLAPTNPLRVYLIMDMVMKMLPLKDLKTARLVCRSWNHHATRKIEKLSYAISVPNSLRLARYKKTKKKNSMLLFNKLCLKNQFSASIQAHLIELGTSIKTLYIEVNRKSIKDSVNFQDVIGILSSTPNLEQLYLTNIDFQWIPDTNLLNVIPNMELSKLITIHLNSCFGRGFLFAGDRGHTVRRRFDWVTKMFRSAPNLITFELHDTLLRISNIFKEFRNLKHLSIEPPIHSAYLEVLLTRAEMQLESLRFQIRLEDDRERMSRFLTYESLKKLDIEFCSETNDKDRVDVYLPSLKNLQEIVFRFDFQKRSGCRAIRFMENAKLRLPKLKTLHVCDANCSILESIFLDFDYIEHLRIQSFSDKICKNINTVLSGLRDPEKTYKSLDGFKNRATQAEIDAFVKLTLLAADPNLRNITNLKSLKIFSEDGKYNRNAQVTELTANFVLLKMQRLESLELENVQLSEATRGALKAYHRIVMFS